jgi:DNA-binding PadR family transcriptional regulator
MPKTKTYLTPAEYAVLGLVRQSPAYGYELQRQLSGRQGLGRVCPVEPAMVYAILKSLSGLELIDGVWDNSTYPPKAVYTATDEGDAAFQRWLRSPVVRMREVRLDFLIKLYFAAKESGAMARDLLVAQIAATREYASKIEAEKRRLNARLPEFDAIVLESKASAARSTRAWLQGTLDSMSHAYSSPQGSEARR